jgi:hypothetical protein
MAFSNSTMIEKSDARLLIPTASPSRLIFSLFVAVLVWLVSLAIYRIYLSPIAHIPGPKLAALTQWYETYYDVYLGGQFTLHQKELHEKYGTQRFASHNFL